MMAVTDQTGRIVDVPVTPTRIISLVPSQTELLYHLGLQDEVIAITKFCIHPQQWFASKTKIGGTKQLKTGLIRQLHPDLIIANKEENVKEQVEELSSFFPVWVSDVNNLQDACKMITSIGEITGRADKASELSTAIRQQFLQTISLSPKINAAYLIWQKPYMTVGGDTFINAMLEAAGFNNIFKTQRRYPEISIEEIKELNCEALLLSSEPFPFKEKHAKELQALLPGIPVILVNGEFFSWYGSRLLQSPSYFVQLHRQISSFLC